MTETESQDASAQPQGKRFYQLALEHLNDAIPMPVKACVKATEGIKLE